MNWTVISLRGLLAPAAVLALGCLGAYVVTAFGRVAPGLPIGPRGVVLASAVAASLAGFLFWRHLRAWESGVRECRRCGGPLGFLRIGKSYRGRHLSDYRRCYNCAECTPED